MSQVNVVEDYRVYALRGRFIIPVPDGIGEALATHLQSLGVACRVRRRDGVPGERVRVEQGEVDSKVLQALVDNWTR